VNEEDTGGIQKLGDRFPSKVPLQGKLHVSGSIEGVRPEEVGLCRHGGLTDLKTAVPVCAAWAKPFSQVVALQIDRIQLWNIEN